MNTTPPLTNDELMAYIERTPELREWCVRHIGDWGWTVGERIIVQTEAEKMARAFHAHEQRVREEEREACAKLIEQRGELYVSKWMNADDMETQAKAYAWESRQHAIAIRNLAKQGGK